MKRAILCFALMSLVFCCSESSVDANKNDNIDLSNYFPLQVGNKWTYEHDLGSEWAITERVISETIQGISEQVFFKAIYGIKDFPEDSTLEYYNWNDTGLYKTSCGVEETCMEIFGIEYPTYQELYIKSPLYEGEEWNRGPEWFTSDKIIEFDLVEELHIKNQVHSYAIDTIFSNVAKLSRTTVLDEDTTKSIEFYAPDFGLLKQLTIRGNDTLYQLNLLDYNLK